MAQIRGSSGTLADVNSSNQLKVVSETDVATNPGNVGSYRVFSENDAGSLTGDVLLKSPETDVDYRQRIAEDTILDDEVFNYTAQNTGKHTYSNTTMTDTWTAGQLTTNGSSITTTTTGTIFATYATFPVIGTTTLAIDTEIGFSAQPQNNAFIEFGCGLVGTTTTAPTDGVFFRLSSAGLQGIASFNGSETSTGVFPLSGGTGTWVYQNGKRYQFICYITPIEAVFWVNDGNGAVAQGTIPLPNGQSRMMMSSSAPFFLKHRNTGGAAGGVIQSTMGAYNVRLGGPNLETTLSETGNRVYGSYQGLSGGTMGTIGTYTNSTNPTAAVPTNTTAAVGAVGLLNQAWETFSLAVNTDGILLSYQVPAATVNVQGKRLKISGVKMSSFVQTVLAGGPMNRVFALAYGHTAVSMATAEASNTKARRIVLLPELTQTVTANQAVNTIIAQVAPVCQFANPIFVNPGEFVAVTVKGIGTVGTSGTIVNHIQLDYAWE